MDLRNLGSTGVALMGNLNSQGFGSSLSGQIAMQQAGCQPNQPASREIPEKIARLFKATECLSDRIAMLESRLSGALVQVPESGNCCTANSTGATQMGDQLGALTARIDLMIQAVESMAQRLEL